MEDYSLRIGGRHVRVATMVTLPNGRVVKFMERMSRREALRQIDYQTAQGNL